MADMENAANINADLFEVRIAGDLAPMPMSISLDYAPLLERLRNPRLGQAAFGSMVLGYEPKGQLIVQQSEKAELLLFLGLGDTAPRDNVAVGTMLTQRSLNIHNPANGADTSADLFFYAVEFVNFGTQLDGQGKVEFAVDWEARLDVTSGDIFRIGPATDPV